MANWKELKINNNLPVLLVSDEGEVVNKENGHKYALSNVKGYRVIHLRRNGENRQFKAHRLVAMAFLPNDGNLPEVNHKNGIKNDNRAENLEWCTRSQNAKHAYAHGLNHPSGGVPPKPVLCVELGKIFPSVSEACRTFGRLGNRQRIALSARNSRYTAYGYHWEYMRKGVSMG